VVELNEDIWSRYSVRCTAGNWIACEQEKLLDNGQYIASRVFICLFREKKCRCKYTCLIQNVFYLCFICERREELEKETRGRVVK
jgi:hypothetical protein